MRFSLGVAAAWLILLSGSLAVVPSTLMMLLALALTLLGVLAELDRA